MSTANPPPPSPTPQPTPILLLKSPSPDPNSDPYTTHLTTPSTNPQPRTYTTNFIPVLTHTLLPDPLINRLLTHPFPYGALIFTSQRATAAFTTALNAPPLQPRLPTLKTLNISLYTVGPATERSLLAVRDKILPACAIYGGAEAGSGEVLAGIILGEGKGGKYAVKAANGRGMKPVLFLTGEKRRDIIPKMLMDTALGEEERIPVDEMVVYQTTELEEFEFSFARVLRETEMVGVRWVVVFSPTAGRGLFRALGWLEAGGKVDRDVVEDRGRRTFVACIGPTTREYLETAFGFRADVVAEKPSPEGVMDGIERFMKGREMNGSSEGYAS